MRVHILGSGCSVASIKRLNTCFLVESDEKILIDCHGNVVQSVLKTGNDFHDIEHVVITHSHFDHMEGLAGLIVQSNLRYRHMRKDPKSRSPLNVYTNGEAIERLQQYLFNYIEVNDICIADRRFPINFVNYEEKNSLEIGGANFSMFPVNHDPNKATHGMRVSKEGDGAFVISADTGFPCENLKKNIQKDDILFHECNHVVAPNERVAKLHTGFDQITALAQVYPAIEIILVHLPWMTDEEEMEQENILNTEHGQRVRLAHDGDVVEV